MLISLTGEEMTILLVGLIMGPEVIDVPVIIFVVIVAVVVRGA